MGRMPTQGGQGNIKALPAIHVSHGSEVGSPREQEQVTEGPSRDPDSGPEPGRSLDFLLLQLKVVLGLGASLAKPALLGKSLLDQAVLPQTICSILRFHNNHVLLEIIRPPLMTTSPEPRRVKGHAAVSHLESECKSKL